MSAHTPGPWLIESGDLGFGNSLRIYAFDTETNQIRYIAATYKTTDIANARLIAAALDMLEALKPFARSVDAVSLSDALGHITREHLWAARAAIAKTEGSHKEWCATRQGGMAYGPCDCGAS